MFPKINGLNLLNIYIDESRDSFGLFVDAYDISYNSFLSSMDGRNGPKSFPIINGMKDLE